MDTTVHVTLRVPKELHEEIMNTNEHSTKNAKYVATLRQATTESPAVSQTNTLEDIKAGVEAILTALDR